MEVDELPSEAIRNPFSKEHSILQYCVFDKTDYFVPKMRYLVILYYGILYAFGLLGTSPSFLSLAASQPSFSTTNGSIVSIMPDPGSRSPLIGNIRRWHNGCLTPPSSDIEGHADSSKPETVALSSISCHLADTLSS